MDPLARLIDANANRAGEALRTLEDLARFGLSDRAASEGLKRLRHELRAALGVLPGRWLHASRDAAGDVGTTVGTPHEYRRGGILDIAIAAERRAAEALRTLEEGLKVVDPSAARTIESARYRAYDLAASIVRRLPGRRREQWRVCVLLTETLCRLPWRDVARAAIEGGADGIQLREKSLDGGELLARAAWLVSIARPRGVRTIINDRVDVALAADADGVHLGVDDLPIEAARAICGDRLLLGASTHDLDEAARAAAAGADYCGVGAMFPGGAKPGAPRSGPAYLEAFLAAHPELPHLAIGGVDATNVEELARRGCRGVAVSGAVCGAERPDEVVATLRAALERGEEIAT